MNLKIHCSRSFLKNGLFRNKGINGNFFKSSKNSIFSKFLKVPKSPKSPFLKKMEIPKSPKNPKIHFLETSFFQSPKVILGSIL